MGLLEALLRRLVRGVPGVVKLSVLLERYEKGPLLGKSPRAQETYQHSLDAFRTCLVRQPGDPHVHLGRSAVVHNACASAQTLEVQRVARRLAEERHPVLIQRAMGHADLATTMGYTHLESEVFLARRLMAGHRSLDQVRALRNRLGGFVFLGKTGPFGVWGFGRTGGFSVWSARGVSRMCPGRSIVFGSLPIVVQGHPKLRT